MKDFSGAGADACSSDEHARTARTFMTDELLRIRKERMLPSVTHYYRKPLRIAKASMQWVWDDGGRRYLDAFGGVVTISAGHNHPRVKKRMQEWLEEDRPQHSTVF